MPTTRLQDHRITHLALDLNAQLNIHKALALDDVDNNNDVIPNSSNSNASNNADIIKQSAQRSSTQELIFGIFRYLHMPQLEIAHKKAHLQAQAHITSHRGLQATFQLRDCDLGYFFDNTVQGQLHANIKLNSSSAFDKIAFDLTTHLDNGVYTIQRSQAEALNFELQSQGQLQIQETVQLSLARLLLNARKRDGAQVLRVDTTANLAFGAQMQQYHILSSQLAFDSEQLYPALPRYLQDILLPYRNYIANYKQKTPSLQLQKFHIQNQAQEWSFATPGSRLILPALQLYDLDVELDMRFDSTAIHLRKAALKGLRGTLLGTAQGKIEKKHNWRPNIDASFKIFSHNFVRVHENISLQGGMDLKVQLQPQMIQAQASIKKLNVEFLRGNCNSLNAQDCKSLFIENLELAQLKIKHDLNYAKEASMTDQVQYAARQQDNYQKKLFRKQDYNLRINRIYSSHNPRGEYIEDKKARWHYIGHPLGPPGLQAVVYYHNNTLYIPYSEWRHYNLRPTKKLTTPLANLPVPIAADTKKRWQRNGILQMRDIQLHLADMEAENMHAALQLQLQDLDLAPFLSHAGTNYNGIINANAQLQLNSFGDDILEKMRLSVSVHRISPEFGGFITRILLPTQIVALLVRNTLEIPAIRFILRDGLIYSYIQTQRASLIPGALISSGSEEIKQERIPITQFIKRARRRTINIKKHLPKEQTSGAAP